MLFIKKILSEEDDYFNSLLCEAKERDVSLLRVL